MNERQYYADGSWGMQLQGGQPEGQLAELGLESKATSARIEAARAMFEEASLDDFEPIGIRGRKWRRVGRSSARTSPADRTATRGEGTVRAVARALD